MNTTIRCYHAHRPVQALACLVFGLLWNTPDATAQARVTGTLGNFDVRFPPFLCPNDLEVVLYGNFRGPDDVRETWNTSILLGGVGLDWGTASDIDFVENWTADPTSPGYGLDCIRVRWAGGMDAEKCQKLRGKLVHGGVRLRPGISPAHWEVWWTLNGERIAQGCDPHITWICTTKWWVICIANPTPAPFYVYAPRWFGLPATAPLPALSDLNTTLQPPTGAAWQPIPLPGGARIHCIPPWCRIYLRVPVTSWRPIIFQVAVRNVDESVLQLRDPLVPDPNDFVPEGEMGWGTMAITTTRPTLEFSADVDGDGAVGPTDVRQLQLQYRSVSPDL